MKLRRHRSADVEPLMAHQQIQAGEATLLDVREDNEWVAGHAPGAVHVPLGGLAHYKDEWRTPVIAVCRSGARSAKAVVLLRSSGVTASNLTGGMRAWAAAGLDVYNDEGSPGTIV